MKTQQILVVAIMILASFFANAQGGGVGINTNTPRSTLEVNGTVRIDSTKSIKNPKRIAVISDSNTVDYVPIDSLLKLLSKPDSSDLCDLDGKVITELFFSSPGTYMDNCEEWIGSYFNASVASLLTYDHINYSQRRDFYSDWSAVNACYSRLKIGSDIFTLLFSWSTNEYRIYRYNYGFLASGGILTSLIGQTIPLNSMGSPYIFYDGTNFLITFKAGNSSNQFILSRYSFNGLSLVYIDDITFIPPISLSSYSIYAIQKLNNFYYIQTIISSNEVSIGKYNLDGSYTGIEKRFYTPVSNSMNLISIGSTIYTYYNFISGPTPTIKKLILF